MNLPSPLLRPVLAGLLLLGAGATSAQPAVAPEVLDRVHQLARQAAQAVSASLPQARVEVELGTLDARLRLAPCAQVQPYLPAGARMWGRSHIGLRCTQGTPWNVFLPVTVKVFAQSTVLAAAQPAGTVLEPAHLALAEVDLAAGPEVVADTAQLLGRALARPLEAGAALRRGDLRARQWFAAGDTVRLVALGAGFSVSGEGQALSPGLEGQAARVRTESGRIVTGMPSGPRQIEVTM